jgi:hypothetical protein
VSFRKSRAAIDTWCVAGLQAESRRLTPQLVHTGGRRGGQAPLGVKWGRAVSLGLQRVFKGCKAAGSATYAREGLPRGSAEHHSVGCSLVSSFAGDHSVSTV